MGLLAAEHRVGEGGELRVGEALLQRLPRGEVEGR